MGCDWLRLHDRSPGKTEKLPGSGERSNLSLKSNKFPFRPVKTLLWSDGGGFGSGSGGIVQYRRSNIMIAVRFTPDAPFVQGKSHRWSDRQPVSGQFRCGLQEPGETVPAGGVTGMMTTV